MASFPESIDPGFSQVPTAQLMQDVGPVVASGVNVAISLEQSFGAWEKCAKYNAEKAAQWNPAEHGGAQYSPVSVAAYLAMRFNDLVDGYKSSMEQTYEALLVQMGKLPENADLGANQLRAKYPYLVTD